MVVEFSSWLFIILAEFNPETISLFLAGNVNRLSDFAFVFSSITGWMLNARTTEGGGLTVVTGGVPGAPVLARALAWKIESLFLLKACRQLQGIASEMIGEEVFLCFIDINFLRINLSVHRIHV